MYCLKNVKQKYTMKKLDEEIILGITEVKKDLGVHVDCGCNLNTHCKKQVSKANCMSGMIRRSFTYLDEPTISQLYPMLIQPHLEYRHITWCPIYNL